MRCLIVSRLNKQAELFYQEGLYKNMAHLLKKPQVIVRTQEGECDIHISLDLNINLNANGVNVQITQEQEQEEPPEMFLMPEFKMEKIKFGEKVR